MAPMTTRERPVDRGTAKGKKALRDFAEEFRAARRQTGLSQATVAMLCGLSRASIGRLERGDLHSLSIVRAAMLAAVVGLDLSVRTYPGPNPARDSAQIRLLRRIRVRLGPLWIWEFEVPLHLPQDQRAWDARATHQVTGMVVVIEAITRLTDIQGSVRRITLKQRDDRSPRVILLLADTRANSVVRAEADEILSSVFPVGTRAALQALAAGRDPGADAIVVL